MANTTNYTDFYYNGPSTLSTAASGTSYTTTTDVSSQQWYYYDYNDHLVKSDGPPIQTRDLPNHSHGGDNGNWTIQVPKNDGMFYDGKEIMKYNGDVQFKVNDEWVSVEDLSLRIKTLEVITEKLYNLLTPWQIKMLELDRVDLEDKKDGFEHFDPDLFKV